MEERKLNEKESLELISQMILNAKQKLEDETSMPFIIFGYATFVVSLIVYFLITKTGNYQFHWLWFLIPMIGYFGMFIYSKKTQKHSRNQMDRIIINVWMVIGIASLLIAFAAFFVRIPILSVMILLMGIGTAITGLIVKSKLVAISGFVGMASSAIIYMVKGDEQILVFGLIFLITMIIPGHLLNFQYRKRHV